MAPGEDVAIVGNDDPGDTEEGLSPGDLQPA